MKAVKRQQPGMPDPIYAAKGEFPAGYPNPEEEVRGALAMAGASCQRSYGVARLQEAETHAERLIRVRAEHSLKASTAAGPAEGAAAEAAGKQAARKTRSEGAQDIAGRKAKKQKVRAEKK